MRDPQKIGLLWQLCLSFLLCMPGFTSAEDPPAKIARLEARVQALEAENQVLRHRLQQIAVLASETERSSKPTLSIAVVSNDWGGAGKQDVLKVLESAAMPIWKSAGSPVLAPIAVENHPEGPMVKYKRGPLGTYNVLLDIHGRYWAQAAFQFSHEMAHILANYRKGPNKQHWLEESICECASLYSLRKMGQTWKTNPPYSNWASYAENLTKYAEDRIANTKHVPGNNLADWYAANKSTLDATSTNRELNNVVALRLLPIFEKYPNSWITVRLLNLGKPAENETLASYLSGWHARVSNQHRPMVKEIADLFSIELHK